jgi:integrase
MAKLINKLDDKTIQNATVKAGQLKTKLADGDNLFLMVTSTSKRFDLRYYYAAKERSIVLGSYPAMSLGDARERARVIRAMVREGIDPIADRERNKAKEAADKATAEAIKAVDANTFKVIALEWFEQETEDFSKDYAPKVKARLENYLFPKLGALPITKITNADGRKVLKTISDKGHLETAKRVRQIASKVFRYAMNTDRATHDPFDALKDVLKAPKTKHFAAPTEPKELAPMLIKMKAFKGNIIEGPLLRLTPYLLVRPAELRNMQWDAIDWNAKEWRFETSKTNQAHIVPLASQVLIELKALRPLTGSSKWVFPMITNFEKPTHENTVINALRSLGITQDEATAHGFRATARTILDEVLNERVDLIEHQLAHRVKDSLGRAYNRTKHLPERHKMMQRWADYLDGLTNGSNVVPFGKVA